MTYHMIKLRIGGLHLAPIGDHPARIMDVGTGTGIWAIDMGEHVDRSKGRCWRLGHR